jgi:hypothetical protein
MMINLTLNYEVIFVYEYKWSQYMPLHKKRLKKLCRKEAVDVKKK